MLLKGMEERAPLPRVSFQLPYSACSPGFGGRCTSWEDRSSPLYVKMQEPSDSLASKEADRWALVALALRKALCKELAANGHCQVRQENPHEPP